MWSWDAYNELYGVTFQSFVCNGGEIVAEAFGIVFSVGSSNYKCMTAYVKDPNARLARVCQDYPGIFGIACVDNIKIYYRVCSTHNI